MLGHYIAISKVSFMQEWQRSVPLHIQSVLISGGWNRGVPLYTEVSSFQGVGIEEFHCIQRCPHFRGLE